jgi:ABC-type microcin C transport system duplicated ATPase subunit YejF
VRIWFQGENLLTKSEREMRELRGSQLTMILQDPMMSLNPLFTIGEQIAEPLRIHRHMRGARARGALSRRLLRGVRIPSPEVRLREYPHQMSGGMRQRIVGAIGISCEPKLLIADEPTTSLDVTIQAQYLNLLKDIQQRSRLAMIFITHNIGIVRQDV